MKLKPKGRKIYRYKTRFERLKGFLRNSGAVVMTAAGIGVLVFVGYSAGGPIMEFLEEQEIITPATEPVTQPAEPQETSGTPSSPQEETTRPAAETQAWMQGCYLAPSALFTESALRDALEAVPEGTTHVFVPLKAEGGSLYYAASTEDAGVSGAVVAALPLETIHSIISEAGCIPAAVINTLEDSVYPLAFPEAGYTIAGSSEPWLDADGKPRLSPFSPIAEDYLCTLTEEIAGAGFAVILCEGLAFPEFSEDDLAQLDPRAGAADRGTALAQLFNEMQEAAGDAQVCVGIDGAQLLAGTADILNAGTPIAPDYAVITVPAGAETQLSAMQSMIADIPCVFQFEGSSAASGAENCIIRPETNIQGTAEPTDTTESETVPE